MIRLALTVVLLAPAARDEAEDLFRKVEARYADAKSIRVEGRIEGEARAVERTSKSTFQLDARFRESKAYLVLHGHEGGVARTMAVHLDGTRLVYGFSKGALKEVAAPSDGARVVRIALARGGAMAAPMYAAIEREGGIDGWITASGFKLGGEEKVGDRPCRILEYDATLKGGGQEVKLRHKIWIDTETLGILKRESRRDDENGGFTATESLAPKFDVEIPDEDLTIPK